jgi:aldose 1-epimerase
MLPTGRRLPAEGRRNLAGGLPLAEAQLDDVLTELSPHTAGQHLARIIDPRDPRAGCALEVTFDAAFGACVVYTPGHREAICIEPYTCVPGRFGGDDWPIERALALLPPGESVRLNTKIELRSG